MGKDAKCTVDMCEKRQHAKGYCLKHYGQIWRDGKIRSVEEERRVVKGAKCSVAGCEKRIHGKGYCRVHYGQMWRHGEIRDGEEMRQMAEELSQRNDSDRVRKLQCELENAATMYRNVVGVEARLRWHRELGELRKEWDRLGIALPASVTAKASRTEDSDFH